MLFHWLYESFAQCLSFLTIFRHLIERWTKPEHIAISFVADVPRSRADLILENALLRQQLIILRRQIKRPRFKNRDRLILVVLARLTRFWKQTLLIIQPDTLLHWHRDMFRWVWWFKSRVPSRSSKVAPEIIELIQVMARDNRLWGIERIRGELLKLGIRLTKRTILKYMRAVRERQQPNQNWTTFISNHAHTVWACDLLQTYDLFFRAIFIFVIIEAESRHIVHVAVTRHPTDFWLAQQLREATPFGQVPRYIIHDRANNYGEAFAHVAASSGIITLKTLYRAPKANAICERFMGSLRRECLDHVIILSERHLQRIVTEYIAYFNQMRPHQGIGQRIPEPDTAPFIGIIGTTSPSSIINRSILAGLRHHYRRAA